MWYKVGYSVTTSKEKMQNKSSRREIYLNWNLLGTFQRGRGLKMAPLRYTQVERRGKSNVGKGQGTCKEKCKGRNKNGVW